MSGKVVKDTSRFVIDQVGDIVQGRFLKVDHDFSRTFEEIVVENDFFFESHQVETEDGYILNLFRIKTQM